MPRENRGRKFRSAEQVNTFQCHRHARPQAGPSTVTRLRSSSRLFSG